MDNNIPEQRKDCIYGTNTHQIAMIQKILMAVLYIYIYFQSE